MKKKNGSASTGRKKVLDPTERMKIEAAEENKMRS